MDGSVFMYYPVLVVWWHLFTNKATSKITKKFLPIIRVYESLILLRGKPSKFFGCISRYILHGLTCKGKTERIILRDHHPLKRVLYKWTISFLTCFQRMLHFLLFGDIMCVRCYSNYLFIFAHDRIDMNFEIPFYYFPVGLNWNWTLTL